jgi:hypothetical protein
VFMIHQELNRHSKTYKLTCSDPDGASRPTAASNWRFELSNFVFRYPMSDSRCTQVLMNPVIPNKFRRAVWIRFYKDFNIQVSAWSKHMVKNIAMRRIFSTCDEAESRPCLRAQVAR